MTKGQAQGPLGKVGRVKRFRVLRSVVYTDWSLVLVRSWDRRDLVCPFGCILAGPGQTRVGGSGFKEWHPSRPANSGGHFPLPLV